MKPGAHQDLPISNKIAEKVDMENAGIVNNYVGIDVGKRKLEVVRIRRDGTLQRYQTGTDHKSLNGLLRWLVADDTVVMEAGNLSFMIAKRIRDEKRVPVVVLNPGDVATIYQSLKKTDREDALKLARLAQRHPLEELPTVRIPSDEEENWRRLCSEQGYWSRELTKGKNRLHSLFVSAGLTHLTKKDMDSKKNRDCAVGLLPQHCRAEAVRVTRHMDMIEENLSAIIAEILEVLKEHGGYANMVMSMPGIGPIAALTLLAYVGNCERFSHGKQLGYYVGMVPRVDISGDTVRYGRIITRGCAPLRRIIIQCANALVRAKDSGELSVFYMRLKERKGHNKAIVAVARKMLEVLYAMITSGELYRYASADFVEKKLKRYGIAA
jgi:transposase